MVEHATTAFEVSGSIPGLANVSMICKCMYLLKKGILKHIYSNCLVQKVQVLLNLELDDVMCQMKKKIYNIYYYCIIIQY